MTRKILKLTSIVLLLATGSAHAQFASSLKLAKKQHLTGEPVIAVVSVTNHSGKDVTFQSDGRLQWLDFVVKTSSGEDVTPKSHAIFGPMKIGAGQTMAREIDLSQYFYLSQSGNYSVAAVVRPPDSAMEGTSTSRAFFNQSSGRLFWSQKIGAGTNASHLREYRIINFSGDTKSQVYAQVTDASTDQPVRTFLLGEILMMRKPYITVDGHQRLHVLFLATPVMWVHYVIDSDGNVISRQVHQRGPVGDPNLLTLPDGTVQVSNSIPYDPAAAAVNKAKIHKVSDRPQITY